MGENVTSKMVVYFFSCFFIQYKDHVGNVKGISHVESNQKFYNTLRILSHISLHFDFYMKNMVCKVGDSSKCLMLSSSTNYM